MKKVILLSILCVYAQSCPTLCDLLDCSPPGSSVHGISRARILEWVAIPYSRDLLYNLHSVMIHCLVSLKHPPKKKGELSSQASLVPPGKGAWPLLAVPLENWGTELLLRARTCRWKVGERGQVQGREVLEHPVHSSG